MDRPMNLQSIVVTNCVGCAILLILLISSHIVRQRRQLTDRLFTVMIFLTASSCIDETITFLIDGKIFPIAYPLMMLTNSWLFIANILISSLWCVYVDLKLYQSVERIRKLYPKYFIPALIGIVGILLNFKWQFVFSIDDSFVYHREPAGYSYYLLTFLYLFGSFFIRRRYYQKFGKNRFFPIYMFMAPIFAGATVQLFVYGVSVAWCSVSLGLVGIYMSLQNELSYIDPLTNLFNRNYLNLIIKDIVRRKTPAGGVMIDLDYFKSINDTFGHSVGDEALVDTALLIRKCAPEDATVVRYAGDEFVVIIRTGKIDVLEEMVASLRRGVDDFNKTSSRKYKLSFSIGYSMYGVGSKTDPEKFVHEMDSNMYEEKREKHSRSAVTA